MRLSQIWIYPIKSLGGISLRSSQVFEKGLQFDRRFMVVDDDGIALTQRTIPTMSQFKLSMNQEICTIRFNSSSLDIPLSPSSFYTTATVKIWDDEVVANEVSRVYSEWFSQHLSMSCRLVFFPETNPRPVDRLYQINNENVSLADAYPLLIIGEASLADLNQRLEKPVSMNRFRPNLVFDGGNAFEEDQWREFRIASNEFVAVKPCSRCILTTVDQETGTRGKEPLQTLSTYRSVKSKIYFGQNVLVKKANIIRVGDEVIPLTYRDQN